MDKTLRAMDMTLYQKRAITTMADRIAVTLNGKPARVSGLMLDYCRVWALDNHLVDVEFAWPTAKRILEAGGRFRAS